MDKIKQGSLYDQAAQRIRAMINDGRLAPGIRVPEKQLCEQFGISRTPLREALKVLASEGFVELLPNRGARVVQLTRAMIQDTLDVTGALEGLSGELACTQASDADIAEIRGLHEQMLAEYDKRDLDRYFRLNQLIHEKIVDASGNPLLIETYQNLSERVRRFRFSATMQAEHWARVVDEHEQILSALEQRDAPRMGNLLRYHLRHKLDGELSVEASTTAADQQHASSNRP